MFAKLITNLVRDESDSIIINRGVLYNGIFQFDFLRPTLNYCL